MSNLPHLSSFSLRPLRSPLFLSSFKRSPIVGTFPFGHRSKGNMSQDTTAAAAVEPTPTEKAMAALRIKEQPQETETSSARPESATQPQSLAKNAKLLLSGM